jgi:glycosyltransferase involved in cell wall biosynthesis
VIATRNAGSVVRDGLDGFVVPLRDVGAIVERLALLAADRRLLRQMSAEAGARAREFDVAGYGRRLLAALDAGGGAAGAA